MAILNCDTKECSFSQEVNFKDIPKYYKQDCPKCGNKTLVSRKDMIIWGLMNVSILSGFCEEVHKDDTSKHGIVLKIDTSKIEV